MFDDPFVQKQRPFEDEVDDDPRLLREGLWRKRKKKFCGPALAYLCGKLCDNLM